MRLQLDPTIGPSFSLPLSEAQRSARPTVEMPFQDPQGGAAVVCESDSSLAPDDD